MWAHVTVGTDVYGRVRKVDTTPIVTRFGMFSGVPVFPLESYYFVRIGETSSRGIPFIAQIRSTEVCGVPLARIDKLSVATAYVREMCSTFAAIGLMCMLGPGVIWMTGGRLSDTIVLIAQWSAVCFAVSVVVAIGTHAVPQTTRREREIRCVCGAILGISLDPARVRSDYAQQIASFLDTLSPGPGDSKFAHLMARTRTRIAFGEPEQPLEDQTDELLEQIRLDEDRQGM